MTAPASKTLPLTIRQTRMKVPDRRHEDPWPELLTVAEVARLLRVSDDTIRQWCASGRLPHVRLAPKHIRVERASLREWLREKQSA